MPLKRVPRIVLRTNTLLNVGALIRFPAILRIAVQPPADFQEAIRAEFPLYSTIDATQVPLPANLPVDMQGAVRVAMQTHMGLASSKAHRFSSSDGIWTIQLAQDYVVLGCSVYPDWETYLGKLRAIFDLLVTQYRPAHVTGLSLRYQNGIIRSKYGIQNTPWGRLLGDLTRGVFSNPDVEESEVSLCANQFDLIGPERMKVRVRHGLAKVVATGETIYSIDNEYLTEEKVELPNVIHRFEASHAYSGTLFPQCISPELFELLGPIRPE